MKISPEKIVLCLSNHDIGIFFAIFSAVVLAAVFTHMAFHFRRARKDAQARENP